MDRASFLKGINELVNICGHNFPYEFLVIH